MSNRYVVKHGNLVLDPDEEPVWMAYAPRDARYIAFLLNKIAELEQEEGSVRISREGKRQEQPRLFD